MLAISFGHAIWWYFVFVSLAFIAFVHSSHIKMYIVEMYEKSAGSVSPNQYQLNRWNKW